MRKLVYFIACTADGFIAGEDRGLDFFPMAGDHLPFIAREYPETIPGHLRKHFGASDEHRHFSSVVMGRHTYEVGSTLGFTNPYPHLQQFLVSSTFGGEPRRGGTTRSSRSRGACAQTEAGTRPGYLAVWRRQSCWRSLRGD